MLFDHLPPPLSGLRFDVLIISIISLLALRYIINFFRSDCDLYTYHLRLPPRYYTGKVAWITGASSGIGLALAKRLAKEGALLILTSRREHVLKETAKSLPCSQDNIHILPLDLSADLRIIENAAKEVPEIFGRLDFVFNNAGRSTRATAAKLDMQYVEDLMHLDFLSQVAIARACLPALREAPGGSGTIANTASIAALIHSPLRSSYSAAKSALVSYFECLALEEPSVSVVNVFPGSVKTPICYNALIKDGKSFGRTDDNIENGLDPDRVADRMLAAVANKSKRSWIARPKELMCVRVSQAYPRIWAFIAERKAAGYQKKIENPA